MQLCLACQSGDEEEALALLSSGGAAVDTDLNQPDNIGRTPLHYAADSRMARMVSSLIMSGCNVDAGEAQHRTALHIAAENGSMDLVRILVEEGNARQSLQTIHGDTALLLACRRGHHEVARYLLGLACTQDLTIRENNSYNCLHLAVWSGSLEITKALLENGRVDINSQTNHGNTALTLALQGGLASHAVIAELLIENGANVNLKTSRDKSALHFICQAKHFPESQAEIEASMRLLKLVLPHIIDANAAAHGGWTPLHTAAYNGKGYLIEPLVREGRVSMDAMDSDGYTAWDLAARRDAEKEVLEALTKLGFRPTLVPGRKRSKKSYHKCEIS